MVTEILFLVALCRMKMTTSRWNVVGAEFEVKDWGKLVYEFLEYYDF